MRRMTWRTLNNVGLSGIALASGLVFSSCGPGVFNASQIHAQQDAPKPKNGPVKDGEVKKSSVNKIPIFSGGKSNQTPDPEPKPATPDAVVQSLSPRRSPPKLSERQIAMLKQSVSERQQVYRDARDNALTSLQTAKESFDRGLMPLADFAEQTSAALEIQLTIADLRNDRSERVRALSDHFELMKTAAKQLQAFDQPASEGWAADTAYINLLAANAALRLAAVRGDQAAYADAAEAGTKLAAEHYTARLTDFQNGQASLSLLAKAASYLTTMSGLPGGGRDAAGGPTKYEEYLITLDDVVAQTQKFAEQGAGIGREDRLFQAQFELAKAEGQAALQKRNPELAAESFNRAANASIDWYESQLKFYQTGTASLRDVTQAWWARAELADVSERAGLTTDDQSKTAQETDFDRLQKLVANTEDRRGRIAADVAYVKSLQSLDSLWARQRAVQAMAAFNGAAPAKSPQPIRGERIINIKPQTGTPTAPKTIPGTTPTQSGKTKSSSVEIVTPKRTPD